MSNPYRDKLLGIGIISRRSGDQVTEGRHSNGTRWKRTENEAGTVTEHATRDDRVDAVARVDTVRAVRTSNGRVENVGH